MKDYSGLIRARLEHYFKTAPHGAKAEFCRGTGIHPQNLKNWLAGRAIPLEEVDAISKGLGISTWELLNVRIGSVSPEGQRIIKAAEPAPAASSRSSLLGEIVLILSGRNETQLRFILSLLKRRFAVQELENLTRKRR